MEALTPDFQGVLKDVETVVDSGLEVFAQNVETVKRLTHPVRDPRAGYEQTLAVLEHAKQHRPEVLTKTSLMLGLGETDEEIAQTMDDLRAVNVDLLTLGQYLRPTVHHLPVQRFVTPAEFDEYRAVGAGQGFPRVRRRSAGALQLSRRAGAGRQQRRPGKWSKWGQTPLARKRGLTRRFGEMAGQGGLRAHLARNAAHHRRARREHAG